MGPLDRPLCASVRRTESSTPGQQQAATPGGRWHHPIAWLAFLVLIGASLPRITFADERVPQRIRKPFPELNLPEQVRGERAIQALGDKLDSVADWHGMSRQQFLDMLRRDRSAWLDRKGRLLFIDEVPPLPEKATGATAGTTAAAAPYPNEQTFLLHSRPGAKRVIYLDFTGHSVSGTAWNNSYGLSTINAQAFDLDGNPSSFNDQEREAVQLIWQRVAEDYAPFDVDVTTEEPPVDAITRSGSTDDTFGTRVVITRDWTAQTSSPCSCGGFAYVGIYDDVGDTYKPAWVFYNNLGNGNEKYVAEAAAHEAGHNLGLSHDGYNSGATNTAYYSGHGSGATGWAPIMGVGYYKELTQWSKGEYPYATLTQDDLAIIQSTGAPLRADDHGDAIGTASALSWIENSGTVTLSGSGVIGTRSDVDFFSFYNGGGNISLTVTPAPRGANLDIAATLYDTNGNVVASANPTDGLNATINVTGATTGTYYLKIDGTGKGDLSTGYSDYGSLGQYSITGTVGAGTNQPPVAAASASPTSGAAPLTVNFSSGGSSDPDGGAITYDWDFGDGTAHSSAANPSHVYNTAGTYTAKLTVKDPAGATASASRTITVTAGSSPAVHVEGITMSLSTSFFGARARASVTILDAAGKAISGATVSGSWSGVVSGTGSATTNSSGIAQITSARTSRRGTFTFTVTGVSVGGYTYISAQNKETSDSIVY